MRYLLVMLVVFIASCTPESKPINYGEDMCHFCKMNIVNKIYGAEVVTDKAKVYKFDAIECMIHFIQDHPDLSLAMTLTNHYETPETLIPVDEATFVISENMPSPMGAFLTAFKSKEKAKEVVAIKGGEMYTWSEVCKKIER